MNPERRDVQEETSGETRKHQWNKGLRLKEATVPEEGNDIKQHLQEDRKTGGRELLLGYIK
jgi:hypothetical protein